MKILHAAAAAAILMLSACGGEREGERGDDAEGVVAGEEGEEEEGEGEEE